MDRLADVLVIGLTWSSLFCLCLALFRFRIKNYIPSIFTSIIILTQLSYTIQSFKLVHLITTVQPICFLLCLLFFFKLNWIYSSIMVIITYSIALLYEVLFNLVWSGYNFDRFVEIFREQYFIQGIAVSALCYLTVYVLKKNRLGFTFIHPTIVRPMPKMTYTLLFIGSISLASTSLSLFFWHNGLIAAFGISFVLLAINFHLAYKKEMAD